MAKISINNGNTIEDVANLSDEDVDAAMSGAHFDQSVADSVVSTGSDRAWLDAYCAAHEAKHGEVLTVG